MSISYLQLNARDLVPAVSVINNHVGLVYGFEVVENVITEIIQYNIDPQHTGFKWMGKSDTPENISASRKILGFLHQNLTIGNELIVMSSKPDIDSVAAAALFVFSGEFSSWENDPVKHDHFLALCERVKSIDKIDCGLGNIDGSVWNPEYYKQNLVKEVTEFNILGAMCSDFRLPLEEKVQNMYLWLKSGDLSHLVKYANQVSEEFLAQKDSTITLDPVPFVQSTARGATGLLYSISPYGVCCNPEFPTQDGTIPKFTICQFTADKYVDMSSLLFELNQEEPGWGGNLKAGIIGSPFSGTKLTPEEVCYIVSGHIYG
jgi:hypothetical protein